MNNEILDKGLSNPANNNKVTIQLTGIVIITVVVYLLFEELREILPENFFELDEVQWNTIGALIFLVLVVNSIVIPTILNKFRPQLNMVTVVLFSGFILGAIEVIFKLIQNLFIVNNNLSEINLLLIAYLMFHYGILGAVFSNIRIHKLRSKDRTFPVLLLVGLFILVGYYSEKIMSFFNWINGI